jgi:calcineurin-like phosphoesterase
MKILMIGDVVGSPGRKIFEREVPRLRKERGIDAVVVNAENCAAGSGICGRL